MENTTMKEFWNEFINSRFYDDSLKKIVYLKERWDDESEYEDFNDYYANIKESCFPSAVRMTKRPFGVVVKCADGLLHIMLKAYSNGYSLVAKPA